MSRTIEEILADPEIGPVVKSYSDKRVTSAIKTFSEKRLDTSTLTARLYRLETAHKEQESKNDLRFHVFKKATEAGISYDLIKDFPFATTEEADKKISALSEFAKKRKIEDFNSQVADASFKPGGGLESKPQPAEKTFDDYVKEIEKSGL